MIKYNCLTYLDLRKAAYFSKKKHYYKSFSNELIQIYS